MAKLSIQVQLKKDSGATVGNAINSGDHTTLSAAKAAVQVVIDQRIADATAAQADVVAANDAFNS